jgi:hypothetical protein
MTKSIDRFTGMLADNGPEPRRAPEIASEAITGAVWDIISAYSSAERMRYLPCLSDHIAFVVLAPYIGPKVAIDTIEQARLCSGRRRSLVAAAQLAAPPVSQPEADSAAKTAGSGAKAVTKLAPKTSAKSAAKIAKRAAKPAAGRASKPTAKAAKPAGKTAAKPAATKASQSSAKATAKPEAKKAAKPDRQPARLPKRPASRSTPSRAGTSRARPRPPK